MKRARTHVSDHAVVRYLERVEGRDIAALKQEIARRVDYAAQMGATSIVVEGFRYVFSGMDSGAPVVATVRPRNSATPIRRSGRRQPDGDEA